MIGIRVDANEKIAMGHLMRCISIAKQLEYRNLDVIFIISEPYAGNYIKQNGFSFICLGNRYDCKETEIERLFKLIDTQKIDKLLIDSYEVTYQYMERLQTVCKIIYIDDLNKFRYPADMIINYTYGVDYSLYSLKGYNNVKFLLGSRYIPLRQEFSQSRIQIQKDISSIFVSTGGTDEYNMIISLLKKLQNSNMKNVIKNVVTGKFYKYLDELQSICIQDNTIRNYHNIKDVFNVMRQSDLAISAGGITVSELFACGVPTICLTIADNQCAGIKAYEDAGMLFYAGDVREGQDTILENIIRMCTVVKDDYSLRNRMAQKAKKVVDGKGAFRIAEAIKNI